MPTFKSFDAALNLDKCFKNTPPSRLNIENLPKLPENWISLLENKCREIEPNLTKNIFFKHIGDVSQYKSKRFLTEQLSLLYHRISGHLDSQLGCLDNEAYPLLLLGLTEDIQECTQGFHIRVNKLINSLQIPKDLDQLLYLTRKSIIQEIASSLTVKAPGIYQVHVADRVIRIAEKLDLGILPNIKQDDYKSPLTGKEIRQVLKLKFPKHYTPLKIPFLLAEQLKLIFNQYGYLGAKKNGYAIGPAENILEIIKYFLPNPAQNSRNKFESFFILDEIDEFGDPTRIYDINWNKIRQLFFQKLVRANYFTTVSQPTNLIEYAYFQALEIEKDGARLETLLIKQSMNQPEQSEFIDHLLLINDKFPNYWRELTKNRYLTHHLDTFLFMLNVLKNNNFDVNNQATLKKEKLVYTLLFSQNKSFILDRIIFPDKEISLKTINFELLLKSIQYRPELTKQCLNLLSNQVGHSPQRMFNLLNIQNKKGLTLMMLAARYHADIFELLFKLSLDLEDFKTKEIRALFLLQNNQGWNFLSLAAKHQPTLLKIIFDFFKKNSQVFDLDTVKKLFYTTNSSHWHFLHYSARHFTERHINLCLNFINQQFLLTQNSNWLTLILNPSLGQLLRLVTLSNLNGLNSFLRFISNHSEHINSNFLCNIFLSESENNWNCIHISARYWPNNLSLLLQFFNHSAKFPNSFIRDLSLAQTSNGDNFLILSAFYQPDNIRYAVEFMHKADCAFNKVTLKALFLHQNSDGWNLLSAAHNQPHNIKRLLTYMNKNNKFDNETLPQIIFQQNKHQQTCLHLASRHQPESTKHILDFIEQHIDSFFEKFEQLLLLKNKTENLLLLCLKHQPDSALYFLSFLNRQIDRFAHLRNDVLLKEFIYQSFPLIQDAKLRKMTFMTHHHLFHSKAHCIPFFSAKSSCSKPVLEELEQPLTFSPKVTTH